MSSQSQNLAFPSQCLSGWELNALEGKTIENWTHWRGNRILKWLSKPQWVLTMSSQSQNLAFPSHCLYRWELNALDGKSNSKVAKNNQLCFKLCCQSHNGSSQCLLSLKILVFLLTVYVGENWMHWRGNRILKLLKTFNCLLNSAVEATIGPHNQSKILPFLLTVYLRENWRHWRGNQILKWRKNIQLCVKLCC